MTLFRRGVLAILASLVGLAPWSGLEAGPIEVRFGEGTAHGLLLVRSVSGETVGHGDFLQTAHGDRVESRLILRFKDGSVHDEKVTFLQQRVFTMLSYQLLQRGLSFPETVEAMVPMLLKNLAPGGPSETVHVVALHADAEADRAPDGPRGHSATAERRSRAGGNPLRAETQLGAALRLFATLLGKAPLDQECLILTEDVPPPCVATGRCNSRDPSGESRGRVPDERVSREPMFWFCESGLIVTLDLWSNRQAGSYHLD